MKSRKRPVVVEAVLWDATQQAWEQILAMEGRVPWEPGPMGSNTFFLGTKNGRVVVYPGDYVVRTVLGDFYPCKPDVFKATHEEVEE